MISYNDLFNQAKDLFDKGNFDGAENILRQINPLVGDNPWVLNLFGLIAQAKGLHDQACSCFTAALRLLPQQVDFYYNLAFSQKSNHNYQDALRNYQKVLSLNPEIKETYNEIACIYEELEEKEKAVDWWEKALQIAPDYAMAEINLANCRKDLTELNSLSQKFPQEAMVWYDMAQIEYHNGNTTEALDLVNKALLIDPQDFNSIYLAGQIYMNMNMNDEEEGIKKLLQAENLQPKHLGVKQKLADIYSRRGEFEEAEKRYLRLIELDKKIFDVYNNYAEMLARQKRYAEALEKYRSAILINPRSAEACNNLGTILKDLKEYDEALGLFFSALEYKSDLEAISINISETLLLLAREDKEKAMKIAINWQKQYPNNVYAQQISHVLKGEKNVNNYGYIEKMFDAFADNYELVMQNLDYSAPLFMQKFAGIMQGRIADLGCGSGLAGQAVKNLQNQIIGVDISRNMLELADKKKVYCELVKSDILDFLKSRHDYDWIMAADVLGYIGDLHEFIKLCRGKKLLFSIEKDDKVKDFSLGIDARYKHNPLYVENLLKKNNFNQIDLYPLNLRKEDGKSVEAIVFVAQ